MTVARESQLLAFDADTAVSAVRDAVGEALRLAVEYTDESFRTLYADETVVALYTDRAEMRDHFSEVHEYVGIDFTEREMFGEAFRAAGAVRALTARMEYATVVRVFVGETEGLLFSLAPGRGVTDVIDAVERTTEETDV